jgi:phosphohistidine phosphatase
MHMLHLLRHAKSSWKEGVDDRERGLNRRGRESARQVGRRLTASVGALDLVLCSSARRTRETLELVFDELPVRPHSMIEAELYAASREELINRLRHLTEGSGSVLLIGHNPGLHELAVALADTNSAGFRKLESGKFPTAARASFRIPDPWSALGRSQYELLDYVTVPSLHRDKD